jgi:hypothetical protein
MPCMSAMQALAVWNPPRNPVNAATIRVGRCSCSDSPFAAEVILDGQIAFQGKLPNQDVTALTSGLKAKVTVRGAVNVTTDPNLIVPCPPPN